MPPSLAGPDIAWADMSEDDEEEEGTFPDPGIDVSHWSGDADEPVELADNPVELTDEELALAEGVSDSMIDFGETVPADYPWDKQFDKLGTYVAQGSGTIGKDLVHTSNLKTCTALVMYSKATRLSFLLHVDDGSKDKAASEAKRYAEKLMERRHGSQTDESPLLSDDVQILVFTAEKMRMF
jgi:hypothetical protein